MNHLQEIYQFDNSHFGKFNLAQHIVMMVVGYNVTCIGLYGTINKLVVVRVCGDEVKMIIGRKEYSSFLLFFLLTEPLMKVHIVNFIKSLLVKNTLIPKLIKMRIKPLGIIIAYKLLDVIQFFIAFDACKHIKQIELGGVENSWLYAFHNLYPINFRCKDKH